MDTASFDNSQDKQEEKYLPKEHLDLPLPEKALPAGRQELPAHASHASSEPIEHEVKTLLSWTAPGRPFQRRSKQYFVSVLMITLLVEIIVFLFGEYLLMLVILSLAFVSCAIAFVPPHDSHYKITTQGIRMQDHFYLWQELYDFYFRKHHDQDILVIRTRVFFPGELSVVLQDIHTDQVKSVLLPFLPFREVIQETMMEKSGNWLSKTFPLEKRSS